MVPHEESDVEYCCRKEKFIKGRGVEKACEVARCGVKQGMGIKICGYLLARLRTRNLG